MFWRLTNQDFNIRLVKKAKSNSLLAGISLPPSLRAPRFSHAHKTPLNSFPFQTHATQASPSQAKWLNSFSPYAEHHHCTDSFNQQQPTILFANLKNVYNEQNKLKYIRQKNYSEKQKTKRAELPSSSKQRRRRTPDRRLLSSRSLPVFSYVFLKDKGPSIHRRLYHSIILYRMRGYNNSLVINLSVLYDSRTRKMANKRL